MNKKEIKAMQREIALRPYKREFRLLMETIRFLGANVIIALTMIFSGWLMLVVQG